LLRPLSAKLLAPTLPEREGWVERDRLFGFQGRTRKPQMALAAELGIEDYPAPAGGCCFLTDPAYGRKVTDLWRHRDKDSLTWEDYMLLKVGRHLRVGEDLKVIVGRDESENDMLVRMRGGRLLMEVEGVPSPIVLVDAPEETLSDEKLRVAARIAARYSDGRDGGVPLKVRVENGDAVWRLEVQPFRNEDTNRWLIT